MNLPPLILESEDGELEVPDYPAIAKAYAEAVASKRLPNNRWMILATKRYLKMLEMAKKPRSDFYFSAAHVVDYCVFAEKLHHFEAGRWEFLQKYPDGSVDDHIILDPSQIWEEAAIHGFRRRPTGERLVTRALSIKPRKNAKSLQACPAALFELCCSGQMGPEVVIAASSAKQADDTLFGDLLKMVNNEPDLKAQYGLTVTKDEIRKGIDRIFKLTSMGERQDGLNPLLALFEEGHAGASSVYNVVMSAFGARPNALARMITTAGYRPEGPGYELMLEAQLILNGKSEDYTLFAAIYTLDPEDYQDKDTKAIDWQKLLAGDDKLLAKANPMWNVSLDPRKVLVDRATAARRADLRGEFARTRYNIWTGSGTSLIEPSAWMDCRRNIKLEDFIGFPCWIGVDLAQVLDMCAIGLMFELPNDVLAVFAKYFLPENSPTTLDPDMYDQFQAWGKAEEQWLTLTPGPVADHDRVRELVDVYCDVFSPKIIACDPHQAHNTVKHLWDGSRPVMVYPNNAQTMTPPTDDILGRIVSQKIWHDGNPVLGWNVNNVHGERRGNGSILPRKETEHSKRKIDGFVAVCFANGVRLQPEWAKSPKDEVIIDPWLARGGLIIAEERANV